METLKTVNSFHSLEVKRIKQLKKERNAIILAIITSGEMCRNRRFLGDSFGLSQKAVESGADIIVFLRRGFHG